MANLKIALSIIAVLLSLASFAQVNAKTYSELENGIYKIYADNEEPCEVSIVLKYTLTNMKNANPQAKAFVIPAKSKKLEIDQIAAIDPKKLFKFSSTSTIHLGNILQTTYDKDHNYLLPFKKGESYQLNQGYNGSFSHKNQNALDFTMNVGTEISAIRDGIVVRIVSKNGIGCKEEKCKEYNNYIIVRHNDGTFAEYTHIQKNGSKVKIGDTVKEGDIIALSGNTGWSSGPHLHLVVYLPTVKGRQTLSTKFLTGDGLSAEVLAEKNTYSRNY